MNEPSELGDLKVLSPSQLRLKTLCAWAGLFTVWGLACSIGEWSRNTIAVGFLGTYAVAVALLVMRQAMAVAAVKAQEGGDE